MHYLWYYMQEFWSKIDSKRPAFSNKSLQKKNTFPLSLLRNLLQILKYHIYSRHSKELQRHTASFFCFRGSCKPPKLLGELQDVERFPSTESWMATRKLPRCNRESCWLFFFGGFPQSWWKNHPKMVQLRLVLGESQGHNSWGK